MKWNELEKHFSIARIGRYRRAYQGNEARAATAYIHNMLLAEAMLPTLNALEIALRNGIHARLSDVYGKSDWWSAFTEDSDFLWQSKEVDNAKTKLRKRGEILSVDKIVPELTFGFWSSLFNKPIQLDPLESFAFRVSEMPQARQAAAHHFILSQSNPKFT